MRLKILGNKIFIVGLTLLCVGVLCWVTLSLFIGKQGLYARMDAALHETINIDYHRRYNQNVTYARKPLKRKVKQVRLVDMDTTEVVVLKDSIEEYLAEQLANQYLLAKYYPLNPDDFNLLFKEELTKRGISTQRVGIVYQNKEEIQYSGQDSISFHTALYTAPVILDIKKSLKVQGWMDYSLLQIWQQAPVYKSLCFVLPIILFAAFLLFMKLRRITPPSMPVEEEVNNGEGDLGILMDDARQSICIDNKLIALRKMDYLLLRLLVAAPGHLATREMMRKELWPEDETTDKQVLNNRLDGYLKHIREVLNDFPDYQLIRKKKETFQLILKSE